MLSKTWRSMLILLLFLLPWQSRLLYAPAYLAGQYWEYGSASLYATEILLGVIIVLFAIDRFRAVRWSHLKSRVHWQAHRNNLWYGVGFLGFLGLEILHSRSIGISYDHVLPILEGACLVIILAVSGIEYERLTLAVWSGGVVQALFAVYQFLNQEIVPNKWLGIAEHVPSQLGSFVVEFGDQRWLRPYGSFGSPNILGGFLAVVFVLGIVMYVQSKPWHKIFLSLGQIIILTGLILSFSRASWFAAAFGWVLVGIFVLRKFHKDKESKVQNYLHLGQYLKQSVFYIIIAAMVGSLVSPLIFARFDTDNRLEQRSLSERAGQYQEALAIIKKFPTLGVGPGAYTLALHREKDPCAVALCEWKAPPDYVINMLQPVHNSFVLIAAEWGMGGLLAWLGICAWLLYLIYRRRPFFVPVIFSMLLAAGFDHFWWSLYCGTILWWAFFGLALA